MNRILSTNSNPPASPGAPVIVSGIGDTSRDEMEALMRDSGFIELHRASSGWWHGYLLHR